MFIYNQQDSIHEVSCKEQDKELFLGRYNSFEAAMEKIKEDKSVNNNRIYYISSNTIVKITYKE